MSHKRGKHSVNQEEIVEEERIKTSSERPSSGTDKILPKSVRGAPEELRHAIRKKQNKEVNVNHYLL